MTDSLKIYSNFSLNLDDLRTLNLLYLPLISSEATSLYIFLHNLLDRTSLTSQDLENEELLNLLGINESKFNKLLSKLEGINLARTFIKDDKTIIILLAPFTPKNFLKDTVLGSYLEAKIGKVLFDKLVALFIIPPLDLKEYKEISHNFSEVFNEEILSDYRKPKENISGRRPNHKSINNGTNFDFDLFVSKIDENLIKEGINEDFKKKISSLSLTYGYNLEQMVNLFNDSIDKSNYFSYDLLKKKALTLYNFLHKEDKVSLNKESKEEVLANQLDNISVDELLSNIIGKSYPNALVSKINDIYIALDLPRGLINLMIIKIYMSKGSIPAVSYFTKMAKSWQDSGIFTTYDAVYKMFNKEDKKVNKKNQKDITLEDWQIEGMNEIMKGFRKNEES